MTRQTAIQPALDRLASIDALPNVGPRSAAWLREIGVVSIADLQQMGPVVAFRLIKRQHPQASLNLLWALAAGLNNQHWCQLSAETKSRLRREAEI